MVPGIVIENLLQAQSVAVLSGSGMSAESGIPTFRDALTGIWSQYRPEDLATPEAFDRDPARVWQWYEARRKQVVEVQPHAGYEALISLESLVNELTIVTQNVDGLHRRAGSGKVLELHGNILRSVCSRSKRVIDGEWLDRSTDVPPRSPFVDGALARPDVVWFGEALPGDVLQEAISVVSTCDVCLAIGTSGVVEPAASLPLMAKRSGAFLMEINPRETPLSVHADHCYREKASSALTSLADILAASERA
jgi:NAD-dependent deacetylase